MMTDPASDIKREVHRLVELQIQTLRQPSCLNTSDLLYYRVRSKKLAALYRELDHLRRASFEGRFAQSILKSTLGGFEGVKPPFAASNRHETAACSIFKQNGITEWEEHVGRKNSHGS
jgi:hypothetical protein